MIINKAKKSTCEYTVESYDGRYFGVRSHTGLFHRASPQRLFHSKEEAVASLGTIGNTDAGKRRNDLSIEILRVRSEKI